MSIRSAAVRAAVLGATALLTTTVAAHADATRLADGSLIDATSDGRYVLYESATGPRLLDRTAGTTIPVPAGAEQLADHSPRILIHDGSAYRVFDATTGTITLATLDESANPVAATKPSLVRDGRSVIFQTATGGTPRILERQLDAATTVERLSGLSLLRASEDAHVITWSRALPPAFRPAGQLPLPADPAAGIPGTAVGYRVDDEAPRVAFTTRWNQWSNDYSAAQCTKRAYRASTEEPTDLEVVQRGAGGTYQFVLHTHLTGGQPSDGGNGESYATQWLTNTSENRIFYPPYATETFEFAADPVSNAYSYLVRFRDAGAPTNGRGFLIGADEAPVVRDVVVEGQDYDTGSDIGKLLPVQRGGAALLDAVPRGGGPRGVYLSAGRTVGDDSGRWQTLPRATDKVDGPDVRPNASYYFCAPTGPVSDYVTVTPLPGSSRAQLVSFRPYVPGKVGVSRMTARVTWLGLTVWTRYFVGNPGTFTTPGLPVGVTGFKLGFTLQMQDGPPLSASQSLGR